MFSSGSSRVIAMEPMGQEVNHVSYSMDRILYTDGTNMSGLHILSVSFPVWDESIQRAACFTDAVLSAATVTQSPSSAAFDDSKYMK